MSATANGSAIEFLKAIYTEDDHVAFRPIETWVENGKKVSKVDYKGIDYGRNGSLISCVTRQIERSEDTRCNVFFGVAPREGAHSFDEAWQIRKLRALWADVDGATVDEVLVRIRDAGLPEPSIVVSSGNGAHIYWLLSEPYLIDDADTPPPVMREWVEDKRKFRKYLEVNGERLYLDLRRNVPQLSPKAVLAQDVLKGIASAIGGDHTHDLARILRIPGTLNRKDQRNGKAPIPCNLHTLKPDLRYSFETFAAFASRSPDKERREKVERVKLPPVRKISAKGQQKLDDLILQCEVAPIGQRSEADYAVVCYCIEHGIDKAEAWAQLSRVGKFADQGERYFETTWDKASQATREKIYTRAEKKAASRGSVVVDELNRPTIRISPSQQPTREVLESITNVLAEQQHCFRRVGQLVAVRGEKPQAVLDSDELAGLLSEVAEVKLVDGDRETFAPLPGRYASTWLNNYTQRDRIPEIGVFTRNPVYVNNWTLTTPGYDPSSGVYYAGPPIQPIAGTEHLDRLLQGFCFQTPADRTNYIAMMLTVLLVNRFIGSKPALLLDGNQPELGKTLLAQQLAILRDGKPTETASFNLNDEEFEKRLGARLRSGASVFIIDNAKTTGRQTSLCIESATLERSITDAILSYRLLGKSEEIRAENSAIFVITANSAEVSRDIFTRCVVTSLFYEGNPSKRRFSISDPEEYAIEHRHVLLGELAGMVERWKAAGCPEANTDTRFNKKGWGNIVGGILEANGEPDFLSNMDEASERIDTTRREFSALVSILADKPQLVWTAGEMLEVAKNNNILMNELGTGSDRALATRIGFIAGRFVAERFVLDAGRSAGKTATFGKRSGRKGAEYVVGLED